MARHLEAAVDCSEEAALQALSNVIMSARCTTCQESWGAYPTWLVIISSPLMIEIGSPLMKEIGMVGMCACANHFSFPFEIDSLRAQRL